MASVNGFGGVNFHQNPPLDVHPVPRKTPVSDDMSAMIEDMARVGALDTPTNIYSPPTGGFHHGVSTFKNGLVVGPANSKIEPLHLRVSSETLASHQFQSTLKAVANNGIQVAISVGASGMAGDNLLSRVEKGLSGSDDVHTMDSIHGYIRDKAITAQGGGYSHPVRYGHD